MSLPSIDAHPKGNALFDLSHLSVLKVRGEKASTYLQGQLTCDMTALSPGHVLRGALCNTKGRVLALLYVIQLEDEICLILPQSLLEKTQKSLAKTAALSCVTLGEDSSLHCFGAYGTKPKDVFVSSSLGDQFYLCLAERQPSENITPAQSWHQYQLMHGEVSIYPETRGLFLPHVLGLQHKGYISFDKGCYRGQEVIARMHYLGKLKYSFQLFSIDVPEAIKPGLKLFDANHTPIGELLDCCKLNHTNYLIAVSVKALSEYEIYIENIETPTTLCCLSNAA